jgi:hypothetical protein
VDEWIGEQQQRVFDAAGAMKQAAGAMKQSELGKLPEVEVEVA